MQTINFYGKKKIEQSHVRAQRLVFGNYNMFLAILLM